MVRNKTRKRLALLFAVALAGTLAAGGAVYVRRAHLIASARHDGELGVAAAKAGDYATAMPLIAHYLGRFPKDSNALYYLALSRQRVPEADDSQLGQAIGLWRRLIDVDAENLDARHQLLDLYVEVGFNPETLEGAGAILDRAHDDPAALRAKAIAQFRLRKFPDAAATIAHLNALLPENFDNQLLGLSIEQANGKKPDELVREALALRQKHTGDVHFALLYSIALANAADRAGAAAAIHDVIDKPVVDAPTLMLLLNQLDALNLFDQSVAAADAAARQHAGDVNYQRVLATRLLIAGDYGKVDSLLQTVSPDDKTADDELLALKGISLALQNRIPDAVALFTVVSKRPRTTANRLAFAYCSAASAIWTDSVDARKSVEISKQSLQVDEKNPFLRFFVAQAYVRLQNLDMAVREWQEALSNAPAWGLPLTRTAQVALRAGRPQDAYAAAQAARVRAPNDRDTLVALASAWAESLGGSQSQEIPSLLALLQDIQTRFPDAQQIRPLRINLLAQTQRTDEALKEFEAALNLSPPPSETTLLQLAQVSRLNKMHLEETCFNQCEKSFGLSPTLALSKAAWLASTGKPKDGLAIFENSLPQKTSDSLWRLGYARYLEMINDARAKSIWLALADAFPTDTNIQWAALTAPSVQNDHDFQGRIIQRLRDRLGSSNLEGRLAQALWLLQGAPGDKQYSEASAILSDLTRASPDNSALRILLANCLQKLHNTTAAVEQLTLASQITPDDNAVRLRLASLLASQGEFADARVQLEKAVRTATSAAERQQAAALFLSFGDQDRALELLQTDSDANSRLLLAELYLQRNHPAEAEALCRDLMQKPNPGLIGLYASTLALQNRETEAIAALGKLDSIDAAPATRALVRAQFYERFGKPEEAFAQFLLATSAAPSDPAPWRALLQYCLRSNRIEDVAKYIDPAIKAGPSDAGFQALKANLAVLKKTASDGVNRAIFIALLGEPENGKALVQTIGLLAAANDGTTPAAQLLPQARKLADDNPRVLTLQLFAAHLFSANNRHEDAIALASRAANSFPNSSQAAQVYTECLAAAGKWKDVLTAAQMWRERTPYSPMEADAATAQAALQLGDTTGGLTQLKPYLDRALKSPNDYPRIVLLYSQDLLATHQIDTARQTLKPLLNNPQWRLAWMKLAQVLPQTNDQASWLDEVAASIPAENSVEKVQLAIEYKGLADRSKDAKYKQKIPDLIAPTLKKSDLDPSVYLVVGGLYETVENKDDAEKAYRLALHNDPKQPLALNNLAMLMLYKENDGKQAADYARQAVEAAPKAAPLYDSQAIILGTQQDFPKALDSISQALKLDPLNPNWKATQIWLLAGSGKKDDAAAEYRQLQDSKLVSSISDNSKKRLNSVGFQ